MWGWLTLAVIGIGLERTYSIWPKDEFMLIDKHDFAPLQRCKAVCMGGGGNWGQKYERSSFGDMENGGI